MSLRYPRRFWGSLTWVGWLNDVLLQWCCVRLGYGDRWCLLRGVIPGTGWETEYRFFRTRR